jgi:hypothetical protein
MPIRFPKLSVITKPSIFITSLLSFLQFVIKREKAKKTDIKDFLSIGRISQIIPRIPLRLPDILPDISPESQYHIDDNRGAHCQDRGVHEILPDLTCCNTHAVANGRANAKSIPLDKVFEFVHSTKIKKISLPSSNDLFRLLNFVLSQH